MKTITVPAGATVTVNMTNNDGVLHNLAVYQTLNGGQTKPVFVGNIVAALESTIYTFTAPTEAGSYFFECDVHPFFMNGTFIVTIP